MPPRGRKLPMLNEFADIQDYSLKDLGKDPSKPWT